MITRHHVALVLLCTLILCGALVPSDPVFILAICLGALAGALLPDIQMKKPRGVQLMTFAWLVTRFSSRICTPLICWMYHGVSGRAFSPGDKRLTHSIPGILLLWIISAAFLTASVMLMSSATWYLSAAFLGGMMLGLVLHLLEDMCTRKGITPLFPFSTAGISGSIRPCNAGDRRIAQFHFYHCSMVVIILGARFLANGQGMASLPVCLFALGSCLGMIIWSSDVSISPEPGRTMATPGIHAPVISDSTEISGNPGRQSSGLLMGVYYFAKSE